MYRLFFFLSFWLINASPAIAIELPDIGTSANTVISLADEQQLGKAIYRQIRQQEEILDDLEINNYLNELGKRIVSYSDMPEQSFNFFVVKNPAINAFAVPGGFIGVHSGLILLTRNESELAAVLAHEIAHVTQRHIVRTLEANQRLSVPLIATMIAAILIGISGTPEVGQAAVTAAAAGTLQNQLNYTRSHEQEADRVGMQFLANAGFDPKEMPRFFQRLQASDYSSSNLPEFLRTHPVTNDRIAEALDRAEKYSQPPLKDTPHYHLMKAKLLVLITDNKQQLLKQLQTMLMQGRYRDERATRYAIALTLLAIKQVAGVQQQVEWLLQRDGDRVVYHILKAQLAWLQKQTTQTLALYEKALQIYPKDFMLSLNFAQTLLQTQAAAKAKSVLLALSPPPNSVYYQLLAQAYQQTGAKAEAHLALAEQFYLQGQMQQALEQLKLARKVKPLDFYLASRIEARYNELQQMWQEEQEQMQEEFKAKF